MRLCLRPACRGRGARPRDADEGAQGAGQPAGRAWWARLHPHPERASDRRQQCARLRRDRARKRPPSASTGAPSRGMGRGRTASPQLILGRRRLRPCSPRCPRVPRAWGRPTMCSSTGRPSGSATTTRPSGSTPTCSPAAAATPSTPPTSWARACSCCTSPRSSPPARAGRGRVPRLRDDRGRRARSPRGHGLRPDTDLSRLRYALLPTCPRWTPQRARGALMRAVDGVQGAVARPPPRRQSSTRSAAPSAARRTTPTPSATSTPHRHRAQAPGHHLGAPRPCRQGPGQGPAGQLGQGRRRRRGLGADEDRERRAPAPRLQPHGLGARKVTFGLLEEPLRYRRLTDDWPEGTGETANLLDRLEVPAERVDKDSAAALKAIGEGRRRQVVIAALRFRKDRLDGASEASSSGSQTREPPPSRGRFPNPRNHLGVEAGTTPEPLGTTPAGKMEWFPPYRGNQSPAPPRRLQTVRCKTPRGWDRGSMPDEVAEMGENGAPNVQTR